MYDSDKPCTSKDLSGQGAIAEMVRQARISENIHSVPGFKPRQGRDAVADSVTSDHGYDDKDIFIDLMCYVNRH